MFIGAAGMLFCLPYLFSPALEDLVGAGLPFLGGSILFAAGMVSLSLQNKEGRNSEGGVLGKGLA